MINGYQWLLLSENVNLEVSKGFPALPLVIHKSVLVSRLFEALGAAELAVSPDACVRTNGGIVWSILDQRNRLYIPDAEVMRLCLLLKLEFRIAGCFQLEAWSCPSRTLEISELGRAFQAPFFFHCHEIPIQESSDNSEGPPDEEEIAPISACRHWYFLSIATSWEGKCETSLKFMEWFAQAFPLVVEPTQAWDFSFLMARLSFLIKATPFLPGCQGLEHPEHPEHSDFVRHCIVCPVHIIVPYCTHH